LSFTGEYRHTIDVKGRLIVPSRLRDELGDNKVVLSRWPDGCVAVWSQAGWAEMESRLLEQRKGDRDTRSAVRAFAASAHQDDVDKQGRINVPQHLREAAGIEREVVVVGAIDHGELWSPDRWSDEKARSAEGGLDELTEKLNF
jgi:MraZ protein